MFIHKAEDGALLIEPLVGAAAMPSLSKSGYQAISEGAFEIDGLKTASGTGKKFFVIYEGSSANVKKNAMLKTDCLAGEAHLEHMVPDTRDDGDIKTFLRDHCVVYVVEAE